MQARRLGRRSGTLSFRSVNPASPSVPFYHHLGDERLRDGSNDVRWSKRLGCGGDEQQASSFNIAAAADAVVLLGVVLLMVGVLMRLVNVRKEL